MPAPGSRPTKPDEGAVGIVVVVHLAVYVLLVSVVVASYGRQRLAEDEVPNAEYVGDR